MPNFWDEYISQNNIPRNNTRQIQRPSLSQFIAQNRGKTLDQMLKEYNINVTEEEIEKLIPQAQKLLNSLGIK